MTGDSRLLTRRLKNYLRIRCVQAFKLAGLGKPPEVIVLSAGGVGTTAILKHLGRFRRCNHLGNRDGLKHLKKPTSRLIGNARVLLVHGDPEPQLMSLERRGLLRYQLLVLLGLRALFIPKSSLRKQFILAANRQFRDFTESNFEVLAVPYESLFEKAEEIARFLEINEKEFFSRFPRRRRRRSA